MPPVSLAEITFAGWGGLDYYDISLVDGYNLPIRMEPTGGFEKTNHGKYDCNPAGCHADLNAKCPAELATKNSGGETWIADIKKFMQVAQARKSSEQLMWRAWSNSYYVLHSSIVKSTKPSYLTTYFSHAGWTVSCMSACMKFNTDQYCCRGAHDQPHTCKARDWPVNYPAIFKSACPDAYSYAYDDETSTFTCKGKPAANYLITFCP